MPKLEPDRLERMERRIESLEAQNILLLNQLKVLQNLGFGCLMPDWKIRKYAIEKGMITPFVDRIVSEHKGVKTLSYGLDCYGYDLRLSSDDFRVFRHLPGQVVDPKNFDPAFLERSKLLTNVYGKYFVMSGNSYSLGVSLERVKMPPNVTGIVVGKSTSARCFSGGTKVKLTDGDFTFLELIERVNNGERIYGYGLTEDNETIVQELTSPRFIENSSIVRVWLDNGSHVDCTPDHEFLMRKGGRKQAANLSPGDSLFPIYQHKSHAYPNKVVRVEQLLIEQPTYCLTAEETGNFALSEGVFVSNCGQIVNCTPIEPGFEGTITLEFSNASFSDLMTYAEEGIAKLLFFESIPCEKTYADRKGKYQHQGTEVTLARV